jgi:hypothetical protein
MISLVIAIGSDATMNKPVAIIVCVILVAIGFIYYVAYPTFMIWLTFCRGSICGNFGAY